MGEVRLSDRDGSFGRGMSRRDFLKLTGAGVAGAALLPACGGFGGGGETSQNLIFSHGPEESGALQQLLDQFNEQNKGKIKVVWQQKAASATNYHDVLKTQFEAGGGDIDVISGDVIWPAEFGFNGWVDDLSDLFTEEMQAGFLSGPLEAVTYKGKVYAVPWFTDAGMMYYRKDLLAKSGFKQPPKTWDELHRMAQKAQQDSGTKLAFVFQGDQYEGGVCNGLEHIWGAGGNALDPNDATKVVIDSPASVTGLETYRSHVTTGDAPQAVVTYQEQDCQTAWLNGDTVFMRNWPYMYGLTADPKQSKVKTSQLGVAPLPTAPGGEVGYSTLGGWNLFINAASDKKEQAWELIKFLASEQAARLRALKGGFLSPLKATYEDPEVLQKVPPIALAKQLADQIKARPASPFYPDMSLAMQEGFNSALKGEASPQDTVSQLQQDMQGIINQGTTS